MGKIYVFDEQNVFICEALNYELLGTDKQEFIEQSKAIQKSIVREVKQRTKRLINKSKGRLDYLEPIQIDIEEAIYEAKKKDKIKGKEIKEVVDEGEVRYQRFRVLEMRIAKGEIIEEGEIKKLRKYQNSGEYVSKKDRDINLEEFRSKQLKEFDENFECRNIGRTIRDILLHCKY